MVAAPVAETMTFEEKARAVYAHGENWTEEFELDGIYYRSRAYVFVQEGELNVAWNLEYVNSDYQAHAHVGQQSMIGYKDNGDFADNCHCGKCTDNPQEYFSIMQTFWQNELNTFGVTWNPDLTF